MKITIHNHLAKRRTLDVSEEEVRTAMKRRETLHVKNMQRKLSSAELDDYIDLTNRLNGPFKELRDKIIRERYS